MKWQRVMILVGLGLWLALLVGCEPLYQSYSDVERRQTTLPVTVANDELWVSSVPAGADVYVQPYVPERLLSHRPGPDFLKGKTPLQLTLPPGRYWIEVGLDADVFASYFSAPFDDVQFEKDGADSEALILKPFAPGEKRRVVRYYRLDKLPDQGQTVVALFYPRGAPLERVVSLYPQEEGFQMVPETLPRVLEAARLPDDAQAPLLDLMRRGGKVFWARDNNYSVSLEMTPEGIRGRVIALYTGAPYPNPLLPDGGGF